VPTAGQPKISRQASLEAQTGQPAITEILRDSTGLAPSIPATWSYRIVPDRPRVEEEVVRCWLAGPRRSGAGRAHIRRQPRAFRDVSRVYVDLGSIVFGVSFDVRRSLETVVEIVELAQPNP